MEIKDDKFYGKRFKTFRVNANKSQKEVSDYLGVTQSTLSKYESGKLQPSFDILIKMKELYNSDSSFRNNVHAVWQFSKTLK